MSPSFLGTLAGGGLKKSFSGCVKNRKLFLRVLKKFTIFLGQGRVRGGAEKWITLLLQHYRRPMVPLAQVLLNYYVTQGFWYRTVPKQNREAYMGRRKRESGFTVIELIVTIAIMGILAGIAIPTFSVWLPNYRLRAAAMDLYSNLQLAKMQAIRTNGEYGVIFDTVAGTYKIVSGGPDRDYGTGDDVDEKVVTLADYGSGIAFGAGNTTTNWSGDFIASSVTYSSNDVAFDARGGGELGTVYVENEKKYRSYAVTSLLNGFIRLRFFDGSAWN